MSEVVTFEDAKEVIKNIFYKEGWHFQLRQEMRPVRECSCYRLFAHCECPSPKEVWLLRLSCPVVDALDGKNRLAYGRWWEMPYLTKSDVARTAFIACLVMEEHECRELFAYKGKAIFGPHVDIDALAEIAEQRENQPDFQTKVLD
jgi:hypothetical protein